MENNINILVDSDSIYFRIACVVSKAPRKGAEEKLEQNWKKTMRQNIDHTMKEIVGQCFMGDLMVAIKGRGNFRNDIYPDYKGTRPELSEARREALNYGYNYMVDKYKAVPADGMEADDLVAIWAYESRDSDSNYVVVGIDKDLLQIPGNHYNFAKRTHTFMDDDAAYSMLMHQCLTGDSTDNIPGIKGIGPKKAEKILLGIKPDRMWPRVKAAWRGHGAGKPELSRRLLEMLKTWEEYNDLRTEIERKATISEQHDRSEQDLQNS